MKQSWKKASPQMCAFLENAVAPFDCAKRSMFGYPVYFVNNNMFAGLFQDDIFIRLSREDQDRLFASFDEASLFEPMAGRPMKEYAIIPESLHSDATEFSQWLDRSFDYVASLPVKEPKAKTKKKLKR